MGWVAARLRAGPIPTLRSLWRGPSLRRTEGGRRERCERLHAQETRLAAGSGAYRRAMRPRPVGSPAACARSCHGRRVSAPTARAVRPHQPRNPHRASVSSARRARREASALWAVGPKAQSDPKRGSETMSATGREARMIEQPGARNAPPRTPRRISPGLSPAPPVRRFGGLAVPVAQSSRWALAAPSARFAPHLRVALGLRPKCPLGTRFPPVPSELKSESSDMRGGFGSLASARQPYAGRRPAKSTAQPLTK